MPRRRCINIKQALQLLLLMVLLGLSRINMEFFRNRDQEPTLSHRGASTVRYHISGVTWYFWRLSNPNRRADRTSCSSPCDVQPFI